MTWLTDITAWTTYLTAAGHSPRTVALRRRQLMRLGRDHAGRDPWALTAEELVTWLGGHDWSADTRRSHRAALRSFYAWGRATGRTAASPAEALPSAPARPGRPRPLEDEVILEAHARADERDRLLIELGADVGLRACEMATLHTDNVRRLSEGWTLTVLGKGGKWRTVPVSDELGRRLRRRPPGWVFPGRDGGHLSAPYVSKRLSAALGTAGTGHQLRHRFATAAYAAERDLRAVQELLGHASPTTTAIYTRSPDEALRRAVASARLAA